MIRSPILRPLFLFVMALFTFESLALDDPVINHPSSGEAFEDEIFTLTSSAFEHEGRIPARYTCENRGISPPLSWDFPPQGTKSFALLVFDSSAEKETTHQWVIYNIPANFRGLEEGMRSWEVADSSDQGEDPIHFAYVPPCPGAGDGRYLFYLYALDLEEPMPQFLDRFELNSRIRGHIVGETVLTGFYQSGGF